MENIKCPKCSGNMEVGFIPDATHGGFLNSRWTKTFKQFYWFKPKGWIQTKAYRCSHCGYIEIFAK